MSKNIIYCFSGTGNCLSIAETIAQNLGDTDIVMMRSEPMILDATRAERVGFVFPCYAGGLPGTVEESVRRIQVSPGAYTFGVCCCAAYPGVGLSVIHSIVPLSYWAVISHQSSCIWLMPHDVMMPRLNAEAAQERAEKLAAEAARDILAGKRSDKAPSAPAFNKVESKAWPGLAPKMAAKLAVSEACVGCGQCERLCPRGNIHVVCGKPVFGQDCIQCLGCLQYCPSQAIHMGGATRKRERYHNSKISAAELMKPVIHFD